MFLLQEDNVLNIVTLARLSISSKIPVIWNSYFHLLHDLCIVANMPVLYIQLEIKIKKRENTQLLYLLFKRTYLFKRIQEPSCVIIMRVFVYFA